MKTNIILLLNFNIFTTYKSENNEHVQKKEDDENNKYLLAERCMYIVCTLDRISGVSAKSESW